MEIVSHLIEGDSSVFPQLSGVHWLPAALDLGRHLFFESDYSEVTALGEGREQVRAVVGDAGAGGGKRGDEIQPQPRAGFSRTHLEPICDFNQASMNGSRSPSSTRSASPISALVRWSFTIR